MSNEVTAATSNAEVTADPEMPVVTMPTMYAKSNGALTPNPRYTSCPNPLPQSPQIPGGAGVDLCWLDEGARGRVLLTSNHNCLKNVNILCGFDECSNGGLILT